MGMVEDKMTDIKTADYVGRGFSFLILLQTTLLVLYYQFHWTLPFFVRWFPVVAIFAMLVVVFLAMVVSVIIN